MKREIKFRGKGITNNEWAYGYIIYWKNWDEEKQKWTEHYGIVSDSWCNMIPNDCIEVIHETIGQFTGLTDNNGNDIYEGDFDPDGNVVVWCENCNGWEFGALDIPTNEICISCHRCDGNFFFEDQINDFEVVGNIYQNGKTINGAT